MHPLRPLLPASSRVRLAVLLVLSLFISLTGWRTHLSRPERRRIGHVYWEALVCRSPGPEVPVGQPLFLPSGPSHPAASWGFIGSCSFGPSPPFALRTQGQKEGTSPSLTPHGATTYKSERCPQQGISGKPRGNLIFKTGPDSIRQRA